MIESTRVGSLARPYRSLHKPYDVPTRSVLHVQVGDGRHLSAGVALNLTLCNVASADL